MVDLISLNEINTIYFDLDGTLRHNQPSFLEALADYNMQLGLPAERLPVQRIGMGRKSASRQDPEPASLMPDQTPPAPGSVYGGRVTPHRGPTVRYSHTG